eukprot:m.338747 g.338747  ORF g.338747 m.338747 type:complete len:487 (+) comp18533_c0_seq1:129-1589(+)
MPGGKGRGRGRGGDGGGRGRGGGRGGGRGRGMSKSDAYFHSIRNEDVKKLQSLLESGCSLIKPYENDTQLPPIHVAVIARKVRSLKCMLQCIDLTRDDSELIDFHEIGEGMTPLMLAAATGWREGCVELLQNQANVQEKDDSGRTAIDHAKQGDYKDIVKLLEEHGKDQKPQEDVKETDAMRRKREDIERTKEIKAAEAKEREQKDVEAKEAKFDERDRVEESQKAAGALSVWDEVKSALDSLSSEIKIDRSKEEATPENTTVDNTLWNCTTLKILRLKLPKGSLTSLSDDLGRLTNLTEVIVSGNDLQALPATIGKLANLKVLDAEHNAITSLSEELSNCKSMEVMNLAGNKLESIAPLNTMTNLQTLNVAENSLAQLDISVENLGHLRVLCVSNNQLTSLPEGMGGLGQLTSLLADNNQLEDLPASMGNLSEKKLIDLQLSNNKFKDRKIKQILEKSVKPVKELTNHLRNRGSGGGGGGKKKKK